MLKYVKCKTGEEYLFIPKSLGSSLTERKVSLNLHTGEIKNSKFGCVCRDCDIKSLRSATYLEVLKFKKYETKE